MRRLHLTALVLPLIVACDRPAKNAGDIGDGELVPLGEVVEYELEPGDSGGSESGHARMLVLPEQSRVRNLVRSGDGVLAVTATCCDEERMQVSELGADLQTLWTLDLGDVGLHHVAPLDDGGWLVSGVSPGGSDDTAIWKLSCCGELESKLEFSDFSSEWSELGVRPLGDGFVLVGAVSGDGGAHTLRSMFLDAEFEERSTTDVALPPVPIGANYYLRGTPAGNAVVFRLAVGLGNVTNTIFEIAGPDDVSTQNVNGRMVVVGDGDDLGWMTLVDDKATLTPYGGPATVLADLDEDLFSAFTTDRRSNIALLRFGDSITEISVEGTTLRHLGLPAFSQDTLRTGFAVAIAEDDSVFVGIDEFSGATSHAVIHHIPAL